VSEDREFVVGRADEFSGSSPVILEVGGRSIGIYRVDGAFYAVQNVCPHALGPVCEGTVGGTFLPSAPTEWITGLEGRVIRCPRHRWEFDVVTGESVLGVDRRRLVTFPVKLDGDRLVVTMRPRSGRLGPSSEPRTTRRRRPASTD
jgi:nitrite reductase/ring-hydroxylating ferredoxin subunit